MDGQPLNEGQQNNSGFSMEESKDNFLNPNVAVNRTDRYQDYNEKQKRFVLTRLEFAQERMQGIKEVVS
jgi:hypothetical protein